MTKSRLETVSRAKPKQSAAPKNFSMETLTGKRVEVIFQDSRAAAATRDAIFQCHAVDRDMGWVLLDDEWYNVGIFTRIRPLE